MKKFFERICNKFLLETIAAPMRALMYWGLDVLLSLMLDVSSLQTLELLRK